MKKGSLLLILISISNSVLCITSQQLDSIYHAIDIAIDSSQIYLQQKTERINILKTRLQKTESLEERFAWAKSIYEEYQPFNNDSAIAYQYMCIDISQRMGNRDFYRQSLMALADQLTESGFYHEAYIHYEKLKSESLSDDMKHKYYYCLGRLYGEMSYYTHEPKLRDEFSTYAATMRDSLLAYPDSLSLTWIHEMTVMQINEGRYEEAFKCCNFWEQHCEPGSRDWATMAYFRALAYGNQNQTDMYRYWLAQAAIVDIRLAIMDQGALWSLANSLTNDNADRAFHYVDFSWKCLSQFSTHMRSWLVAPIVININNQYKQSLQDANRRQTYTIAAISILAVVLLLLLFYVLKKRRQLSYSRSQLQLVNQQLSEANSKLSVMNEHLHQSMLQQNELNRVKDEYLGSFFSICSEYIDKLDNYRIKMNRKLKAGQYKELLRMTDSEQMKSDELEELFHHFDEVFLHIFPTFVDDFNALLRPEERLVPPENSLSTDLRIFALVRLGITESSKIAEFLHYSPNSIYAYRARIKNKAAGNRDEFERDVMKIGLN